MAGVVVRSCLCTTRGVGARAGWGAGWWCQAEGGGRAGCDKGGTAASTVPGLRRQEDGPWYSATCCNGQRLQTAVSGHPPRPPACRALLRWHAMAGATVYGMKFEGTVDCVLGYAL